MIPSPNVAEDHQTKNAMALVDKGAAVMIRDTEDDFGVKVECRPVPEEELETFEEAGACGTAA